ncbi:hypothetical protein [Polaribacter porphyrae]|uniref:Carboxypeptidase regulatory-like domain-containing protein n=1 Tax=Polaribacter porphyrae TaxID=1137780 RepID=A0A2S7WR77_9FLAO|nr:hypothetical protein [Polaribacter porphyrae]PQJ80094.1 hypothetical protein BTO18_13325 [Polaribacter porphyrae]
MKSKKLIALFTYLIVFIGCKEQNNDIICTLEFVYGLNITLIDAETSKPIEGNVKVVIKDGNYEEVLQGVESGIPFFGAGERSGTYTITITSNNYKTFVSNPIVVTANECHVITVTKTFNLERKI